MKKYFLIFCFLNFHNLILSQEVSVKIDTNVILIGQQIKFTVECNDVNIKSSFPIFLDTIVKGIEIIKQSHFYKTRTFDYSLGQWRILHSFIYYF